MLSKLKKILNKVWSEIIKKKKNVAIIGVAVFVIALSSLLIEYYSFGTKLHALERINGEALVASRADVDTKNFSINEKGEYVSVAENASLTLETHGKYVQNLDLDLGENPSYATVIKFVDHVSGQEIVLQNRLQRSMQKGEFNFLKFSEFSIQNNPEKITIIALNPGVTISDIKIDNAHHFNFYRFSFIFWVGVLLLIFFMFRRIVGKKPEYLFFAIAMICGTLISFSELPEYVSWDEAIHHGKANENSFGNIIGNGTVDIFSKTNSIPASNSIKEQESINAYFDNLKSKPHKSKGFSIFNFSLLDFYNQLGHLPSGFALMMGRLMQLPNHLVFILGRWINDLVYSLVIFLAIRKLKTGKMIMAVVALFPTAIFLASNYGYDYWVTAFTMLGLTCLFNELQQPEKKISKKNAIIMLGSFVLGLGPKAIYFPLMFLLFLLKKEKFESREKYKKFVLATCLSILFVAGSFMLPFVIGGPGKGDRRGGEEVNSAQQVAFILSKPVTYAKILFSFIWEYVDPRNASGAVSFFAYLGSIKGFSSVMAVLVIVFVGDKNNSDKQTSGWKIKALMIAIFFGTVALISTALYVAFTAVGSSVISGVQPRYLIPLIFPLLFVMGSSRVKNPFNRNIFNGLIFAVMAFVILQGIWDAIVFLRY